MPPSAETSVPSGPTIASLADELLSTSTLRIAVTTILVAATMALAIRIASPTRMMTAFDTELRYVEQIYETAIGLETSRLTSPTSTDMNLAWRLISLEDRAANIRTQILRYSRSSHLGWWWSQIRGCCTGHSLEVWRCSQELVVLRGVIELSNQEARDRFNTEVARINSPVIQLALRQRYETPATSR
ncbi:hypothetical protein B0H19DRAFT_1274061 [Mycena capillaripes]|nr:hypothetical protein B0H19DRAFT_1274061 [Mycena capillaripes]